MSEWRGPAPTERRGTTITDLYYSQNWQVLEEQVGGAMRTQYVWSPQYVDALIARDTAGGPRLYVQQDANWNVTALVDAAGAVQERYLTDPYGTFAVLTPTWTPREQSQYSWVYLHQGGRFDAAVGLYHFRNRDYSPTLGRWLQQDPAGYTDGLSLYQYLRSDPVNAVDPMGRETCRTTGQWDTPSMSNPDVEFRDLDIDFDPSLWPPRLISLKATFGVTATVTVGLQCTKTCTDDCGRTRTTNIRTSVTVRPPAINVTIPIPIVGPASLCAAAATAAAVYSGGAAFAPVFSGCMWASRFVLAAYYATQLVNLARNPLFQQAMRLVGNPSDVCRAAMGG